MMLVWYHVVCRMRAASEYEPGCSSANCKHTCFLTTVLHCTCILLHPTHTPTPLPPPHRKVENKLLEMLNMRGRHKHKWDSLRAVLADKIVYDDNNIRIWMAPDGSGQGLLYYAKQAQVCGWLGGCGVLVGGGVVCVGIEIGEEREVSVWHTC